MNVNLNSTELTLLMKLTLSEYENSKRKYFATDTKRPPSEINKMYAAKLLYHKLHAHRWFAYQETNSNGKFRANHSNDTLHLGGNLGPNASIDETPEPTGLNSDSSS